MKTLKGTKTEKNLLTAFARESQARESGKVEIGAPSFVFSVSNTFPLLN
jgi:hypothetical protein